MNGNIWNESFLEVQIKVWNSEDVNNCVGTYMKIHYNSTMVCVSYALKDSWKCLFILCSFKLKPTQFKIKNKLLYLLQKYMHAVKLFTTYDADCPGNWEAWVCYWLTHENIEPDYVDCLCLLANSTLDNTFLFCLLVLL